LTSNTKYHQEFLDQAILRLNENLPRIKKCLDLLLEDQLWIKENPKSNSVANIILHLCGNVRQYIMSSIDGQNDVRKRDKEFNTSGGRSGQELYKMLDQTMQEAIVVIGNCKEEDMLSQKKVQVYELSNVGIILHVTEHFSYHTGQIATMTKAILNKDLGFYKGVEL
jgi:uncharacterized damage-inducible protein DinB